MTVPCPNVAAEGLFQTINELMEQRQTEGAGYRRKEQDLRRQIADVSHDLRTPLTSILGYLQLVEEDSLTPEQRREYLAVIRSRAATLQTLITSFYDLSRIEGGQWQLEREPVDLARELADQLAAAYEQLEQAGLQVSVKIADGLPPVWGDRNGVVRVLSNLLTNAYRHGTGTLEARLYREGDHVVSAFSNDAPGMTDEDVERVFERFYRVDKSRSRQTGGCAPGRTPAWVWPSLKPWPSGWGARNPPVWRTGGLPLRCPGRRLDNGKSWGLLPRGRKRGVSPPWYGGDRNV